MSGWYFSYRIMQEYILEERGTEDEHYYDINVAGFTYEDDVFTVWYSAQVLFFIFNFQYKLSFC